MYHLAFFRQAAVEENPSTSLAAGGWVHDTDYTPALTRLGACPVGAAPSPQGAGELSNQAY